MLTETTAATVAIVLAGGSTGLAILSAMWSNKKTRQLDRTIQWYQDQCDEMAELDTFKRGILSTQDMEDALSTTCGGCGAKLACGQTCDPNYSGTRVEQCLWDAPTPDLQEKFRTRPFTGLQL